MLYIGETKTPLATRFSDHLLSIRSNLLGRPVAEHFNSNGHAIEHAKITGILSTSGISDKDRHSTACPNKNLTIFARIIEDCKWKFWNKFGLHFNNKRLKFCLLFVSLKSII